MPSFRAVCSVARGRVTRMEQSTQLPDTELMLAVSQGHDEAFDALRERYYGSVVGFLTALVGDDAASEATEATFAAAHESLRSFQPERFKSWLFAEAHRTGLALNDSRSASRRHFWRFRFGRAQAAVDGHRRPVAGR